MSYNPKNPSDNIEKGKNQNPNQKDDQNKSHDNDRSGMNPGQKR